MALKGRLEDVALVEVVQLIAFAGKTGTLSIHAPYGEGGMGFRGGRVVSAYCWTSLPVDPRAAALSGPQRDTLVRERITMAFTHLLRLREGHFEFTVSEQPPRALGGRDVTLESADRGFEVDDLLLMGEME